MGCNYYLRPQGFDAIDDINKNTQKALDEINETYKSTINDICREACKISPLYEELLDLPSTDDMKIILQWEVEVPEIHICKMSLGWVPCFEINDKFKTLKEFLKFYEDNKNVFTLINEYNEKIDINQFKEDLEYFKQKAKPDNIRTKAYGVKYYKDEDGYDWVGTRFS